MSGLALCNQHTSAIYVGLGAPVLVWAGRAALWPVAPPPRPPAAEEAVGKQAATADAAALGGVAALTQVQRLAAGSNGGGGSSHGGGLRAAVHLLRVLGLYALAALAGLSPYAYL